jgi:hypothetical protein
MGRANEYTALSETLDLELPKLRSLTSKLGNECLARFVAIQTDWWYTWTQKLKTISQVSRWRYPKTCYISSRKFTSNYKVVLRRMEEFSIVKGSLLEDGSQWQHPANSTRRPETLSSGQPSPSTLHKSWETEREMKGRSSVLKPDSGPQWSGRPFPGISHGTLPFPNQEGGPGDLQPSRESIERARQFESGGHNFSYSAASLREFNLLGAERRSEAGYPYLEYKAGEVSTCLFTTHPAATYRP